METLDLRLDGVVKLRRKMLVSVRCKLPRKATTTHGVVSSARDDHDGIVGRQLEVLQVDVGILPLRSQHDRHSGTKPGMKRCATSTKGCTHSEPIDPCPELTVNRGLDVRQPVGLLQLVVERRQGLRGSDVDSDGLGADRVRSTEFTLSWLSDGEVLDARGGFQRYEDR